VRWTGDDSGEAQAVYEELFGSQTFWWGTAGEIRTYFWPPLCDTCVASSVLYRMVRCLRGTSMGEALVILRFGYASVVKLVLSSPHLRGFTMACHIH
jgi:hypothetical protein